MTERNIEHIGIVGGGQLGRMLAQAAIPMGFEVTVINPGENGPAAQVGAHEIVAPLDDTDAIDELATQVDVVTWEIEHIPGRYLVELAESGIDVQPSPKTLEMIQDKLVQKEVFSNQGIPLAPFSGFPDDRSLGDGPYVVKSRKGGFDGRGNLVVDDLDDPAIVEKFDDMPTYTEKVVDFDRELAVIVARDRSGNTVTYPVVETVHENNICDSVTSPPMDLDRQTAWKARDLGNDVLKLLEGAGVFAIEMFLVDGELMVNEVAPRVHNSGHLTIEANVTSQFQQHIRAIAGLPLGSTDLTVERAVMVNILGRNTGGLSLKGLEKALRFKDVHVHLYGKDPRPERKIGHVTALERAGEHITAAKKARDARNNLSV